MIPTGVHQNNGYDRQQMQHYQGGGQGQMQYHQGGQVRDSYARGGSAGVITNSYGRGGDHGREGGRQPSYRSRSRSRDRNGGGGRGRDDRDRDWGRDRDTGRGYPRDVRGPGEMIGDNYRRDDRGSAGGRGYYDGPPEMYR